MEEEYKKRIIEWLNDYPKRKGIVVLWDDKKLEFIDIANVNGLHAAEFATKYRDHVLKSVELDDFMTEDLPTS